MSCKFEDCRCWWAKLCVAHSCQGAPKKIPKIHSYCTRAVLFEWGTHTLFRSTSQTVPQHHCGMESHSHRLFLSKHRHPRFLLFLFFAQLEHATLHHCSIALPFVWLALCTKPRPIHSNAFSRLNPALGDHRSMYFKVVCSVRSGNSSLTLHLVGRCGICFSFPWRPLLGLTFPSRLRSSLLFILNSFNLWKGLRGKVGRGRQMITSHVIYPRASQGNTCWLSHDFQNI